MLLTSRKRADTPWTYIVRVWLDILIMTARISDASSTQQSSSSKPTVRFNGPPSQEIELMFLMSGLRKGGDRVSTSADMSPRSSTMEDEPIAASDDVQRWLERMPAHWRAPDSSMLRHTFASSCSTALKQPDLTELWVACRDEESFQVYRDSLMKRTLIITVVVSDAYILTALHIS